MVTEETTLEEMKLLQNIFNQIIEEYPDMKFIIYPRRKDDNA